MIKYVTKANKRFPGLSSKMQCFMLFLRVRKDNAGKDDLMISLCAVMDVI